MNGYEKRVVYFDWVEGGERIGNAGFAKVIIQSGQLRLMVNISGLHKTGILRGELMLLQNGEDVCLDSLYLKEGRCVYSRLIAKSTLEQMGVCWEDVYGICVKMGEYRCLKSLWGVEKKHTEEESDIKNSIVEEVAMEEIVTEKVEAATVDVLTDKKVVSNQILDDKWKQLEQLFPHVHPFGDCREYLSIAPKDFIVLTREYQCLANNSFLLHGFYNYHHIILGKVSTAEEVAKEEEKFYLGVPGVFYEREKAVAIMFGFESFECAKEPAETGTFGYYMKHVEI